MSFPRPRTPVNSQPQLIASGLRTPPDQEMSDQPMSVQPSPRPLLPTSSADFALSVPVSPSTSVMAIDDQPMMPASPFASPGSAAAAAWNYNAYSSGQLPSAAAYPLLRKLRRPSLLGPLGGPGTNGFGTPSRLNSPLVASFTSANSPFGFEPSAARPSSGNGKQAQRVDEDAEEYTPVLLTYEGRARSREGSSSRSGSSSRNARQRYHRSMSPQTPPPRNADLESLTNEEGPSSSRKRPTQMLRRSSSSGSVTDPQASTSKSQPIPVNGQPPSLISAQSRKLTLPRLRSIVSAETNPAEVEVKSEARFQRFVASHAEFPTPFKSYPKTPRSRAGSSSATGPGGTNLRKSVWPSEKGRFPEEALADDDLFEEENSGDSDGFEGEGTPEPPGTAPMSFTEDGMMSASLGGALGIHRGSSGSLGPPLESPAGMDLDVAMTNSSWGPGSPPVYPSNSIGMMSTSATSTPNPQWRHTPPPTAAGPNRVGKRKFDDRYDPYPNAKRRAVSPAVSLSISPYHPHPALASPITLPRSSPITIPRPLPMSAASSPVMRPIVRLSGHYANGMNSGAGLGGGMGLLGVSVGGNENPNSKGEKAVNGAGNGVGSLAL